MSAAHQHQHSHDHDHDHDHSHAPGPSPANFPQHLEKKGKFNDIAPFLVRRVEPEEKKPIPLDPVVKDLQWYKEECPAIQESDEAGYLVSVDVLTEAKILRRRLEPESTVELAVKNLIESIEPVPGPDWPQSHLVEFYLQCVTAYALRRVNLDRSDQMKFLLEGMAAVPPEYQIPCLSALFGEEVVTKQLVALDPRFADAIPAASGSRVVAGPAGGSGPGSGLGQKEVQETDEQRARRQAKNKKKNAQKKRKAAEKATQEEA